MPAYSLTFHIHLPYRLSRYSFFDIGKSKPYLDLAASEEEVKSFVEYRLKPLNQLIKKLNDAFPQAFTCSIALSGTAAEQFKNHPKAWGMIEELVQFTDAEMLASPYFHSLSFLYQRELFESEVQAHKEMLQRDFGQQAETFVHPGLFYFNYLGYWAHKEGFKGMIAAQAPSCLGDRDPYHIFHPPHSEGLSLLLSDSYTNPALTGENPNPVQDVLSAHKHLSENQVIPLQWDLGLLYPEDNRANAPFNNLKTQLYTLLADPNTRFLRPQSIWGNFESWGTYDAPGYSSMYGETHPLATWREHPFQSSALEKLYQKVAGKKDLSTAHSEWKYLQSLDHFALMQADPSKAPILGQAMSHPEAYYRHYMNMIADFELGA